MDDLSSQRSLISSQLQLAESILTASDRVLLVSRPWLQRWEAYTQSAGPNPGPVDNTPLYTVYRREEGVRTARLRKDMTEGNEFVYVSPFVWEKLKSWYGGEPETELFVSYAQPDWNPILISVETHIDSQYFRVSLNLTLPKLKIYVCQKLQLPHDKYELSLGEKRFHQSLAATLRTIGAKEGDIFTLKEKPTFDLQSIEEEDCLIDTSRLPPPMTLTSPFDEVADFQHGPIIESTTFDMDFSREDRAEVSSRIAATLRVAKTRLSVSNIAQTNARIDSMLEVWKQEDVFR